MLVPPINTYIKNPQEISYRINSGYSNADTDPRVSTKVPRKLTSGSLLILIA